MKLVKLYAYWKIWDVYQTIMFDCMHYFQPNLNKPQYSKKNTFIEMYRGYRNVFFIIITHINKTTTISYLHIDI